MPILCLPQVWGGESGLRLTGSLRRRRRRRRRPSRQGDEGKEVQILGLRMVWYHESIEDDLERFRRLAIW